MKRLQVCLVCTASARFTGQRRALVLGTWLGRGRSRRWWCTGRGLPSCFLQLSANSYLLIYLVYEFKSYLAYRLRQGKHQLLDRRRRRRFQAAKSPCRLQKSRNLFDNDFREVELLLILFGRGRRPSTRSFLPAVLEFEAFLRYLAKAMAPSLKAQAHEMMVLASWTFSSIFRGNLFARAPSKIVKLLIKNMRIWIWPILSYPF